VKCNSKTFNSSAAEVLCPSSIPHTQTRHPPPEASIKQMPFVFIPQHPGIDENQPGNTTSPNNAAHIFDSYSKEELKSVHKFNAGILVSVESSFGPRWHCIYSPIRSQKKDSKWPPSRYLMQVMNEQAEIEFRLERMEQETKNESEELDDPAMGDEPEYMLATKYKAMISPLVRIVFSYDRSWSYSHRL
jgi:hypothetical protein